MLDQYVEFLTEVEKDFPTPLSEKVNILEYAIKLMNKAVVSALFENNKIIGMAAIYCNDNENGFAYIPIVAIHKKMRGRKLSKSLIQSLISIAKERGAKKIGIHTENPVAQKLYESTGFKIIEDKERKYLELTL